MSTLTGHDVAMSQPPAATTATTVAALSRPPTVVVADAMILMRMSCRLALASAPSALAVEAAKTKHARIYVTAEVEREVIQRMEKVAKNVTVDDALAAWRTRLAPSLRVVDLPFGDILHPSVRRITDIDPDDVLTGSLALMIGPAVVWSEDRSLTTTGFASPLNWQETGEALVDIAASEADWAAGLGLAGLGGATLVDLVTFGARHARRGSLQAVGVGLAVGAVLFCLIGPKGSRWPRTRSALINSSRRVADSAEQLVARWDAAEARLYRVQPRGLDGLVEGTARILARAPEPMTASELRDELRRSRRLGLNEREITAVAVERALAAHPAFHRSTGKRWILGRPVRLPTAPMADDA
jgi:predicted nucleic acid-binding protein